MQTRNIAAVGGAAALVAGLGACGSAASQPQGISGGSEPGVPQVGQPVSPVKILHEIEATVDGPAGHDISGNPRASGTFPCDGTYEQITVDSYPDAATLQEVLNQGAVATSSTSAIVTAQNAEITVTPVMGNSGNEYSVTPAHIATMLHGTVYVQAGQMPPGH